MAAGVLGITRITGQSTPAISRIRAQVRPAAMVTSTKQSSRSFSTGVREASISPITWGFTPRKISRQARATSSLVPAAQPSSSARASALAGVRLASSTCWGGTVLQTARARAAPMFPVPINPTVAVMCGSLLLLMLFSPILYHGRSPFSNGNRLRNGKSSPFLRGDLTVLSPPEINPKKILRISCLIFRSRPHRLTVLIQ